MIGSTAWNLSFQSAMKSSARKATTVVCAGSSMPKSGSTRSQIAVGQPSTTASSPKARTTRFHSNGTSEPHLFLCA